MGDRIVAPVTFGVGWIAKEYSRKGAGCEFVRGGGRSTSVAKAAEDAETIIGRRRTEEKVVRSVVPTGTAWADVEKKSGGGEGIGPKSRRDVGMEKKGADTIIKGPEDALDATVLLGGVGASEAKNGAVGC